MTGRLYRMKHNRERIISPYPLLGWSKTIRYWTEKQSPGRKVMIAQNAVGGPCSLRIEDDTYGFNEGTHYRRKRFLLRRSQSGHGEAGGGWKTKADRSQRLAFSFSADFSSHIFMRLSFCSSNLTACSSISSSASKVDMSQVCFTKEATRAK